MSDDEVSAPTGGMGEVDMDSNYPLDDLSNYDPQEVGSERDISPDKDGGVTKKLLVRGEGFKMPEKGDEVTGALRRPRGAPGVPSGSTFSTGCRRLLQAR